MSGYLKIQAMKLTEGILYGELAIPNKEVAYLYRQTVIQLSIEFHVKDVHMKAILF